MNTIRTKPIAVHVTAERIRDSVPHDCFRCAVAVALGEATGDDEARVVEHNWTLYLVAWSQWIVAPSRVREFVHAYDDLDKGEDDRVQLPEEPMEELAPFNFELPPLDDPEWQEECYGCGELFDSEELDDDGCCEDCRDTQEDNTP